MSKNEWKKWVSVVGRLLLAYALVFAQGAWVGVNPFRGTNLTFVPLAGLE